jgi:hypothetical protein
MGAPVGQSRDGPVLGHDKIIDPIVEIRKRLPDGPHVTLEAVMPADVQADGFMEILLRIQDRGISSASQWFHITL